MGCGASRPPGEILPGPGATATDATKPAEPAISAGVTATVTVQPPPGLPKPMPVPSGPTVKVKAWVGNSADGTLPFPEQSDFDFEIPSLKDKADLAVCISGGGFRATTLGLGWLRALQYLGVLSKVKYLCTNSGSSWLGAAMCFQRTASLGQFLGHYFPPEECSLDALERVGEKGRSYAAAVADAEPLYDYVKAHLAEAFDGDDTHDGVDETRAWTRAMTSAFLEPFGLGEADGSTVSITGTKSGIHSTTMVRGAKVGRGTVHLANPQQPYLVICQVVMLPNDPQLYYPYEWTPLYSGCPVPYSGTDPRIGGGWVEALGVNAHLADKPSPAPKAGDSVQLLVRPVGPASLGEAIGISSAYNSYKLALGQSAKGRAAHKALGFNTAAHFSPQDWETSSLAFTDGGGSDYHALYPALRRRVSNIILLSASRTALADYDAFGKHMKDLPALFGCWPGDPEGTKGLPGPEFNKQRQVFAAEGYADLYKALLAKVEAGEPAVHTAEYEVLPNPAMGVPGGWRVRVMWVVNERQTKWEAALPEDTRAKLESDRNSFAARVEEGINPLDADTFREFPLLSTFAFNYTPELVGLMANHAAHMLVANRESVAAMTGC